MRWTGLFAVILASTSAWAETHAVVTCPAVAQSGPGTTPPFYPTSQLAPGQPIVILSEEGDFYAIRPPPGSFSYVPCSAIRLIPGETGVGVVQEDVTTLIGSELSSECNTQGVRLSRGTLVRIVGQQCIRVGQAELSVYRIEPVGEKRYVPKQAVACGQVAVQQLPSSNSNTLGQTNFYQLRQQAEQAYQRGCQTGDFSEAIHLYQKLSQISDTQMRWEALNRLEFIRLRQREWTDKKSVGLPVQPTAFQPPHFSDPTARLHTTASKETWQASAEQNTGTVRPQRVCGVLRRSAFTERGRPLYYLEDHLGHLRCYLFAQDLNRCETLLHHNVEVYGTAPVYRGDLRAELITVVSIRPLP